MPNSAVKPLILVVEDDPAVRNLIVAALEAHGLRHMAVETAHAAIAAASSQTPSIVLLDLGLPDFGRGTARAYSHDAQAPFVCAGWHGCVRGLVRYR